MWRTVAFVFHGGGSLSAPQIGMLRALTASCIAPQLVVGTSAGALNALAYATDPSLRGLGSLEDLWLRLRRRNVARLSVGTFARAMIGRVDGVSQKVLAHTLQALERDGFVTRHQLSVFRSGSSTR